MRWCAEGAAARRRGVVAVFVAVCLIVIVGVVALVVDSGMIRDRRQHLQASADAAALAAAIDLFHNYQTVTGGAPDPSGQGAAAARAILQDNGYSATNATITVNIPPQLSQSGFNGELGYAEVIVSFNQARHFSTVFGSGDIPIRARAIARGLYQPVADRIIILDPSARAAFNAGGNARILVDGTNIIVNSSHGEAAVSTGRGLAIEDGDMADSFTPTLRVNGGFSGPGRNFSPAPVTGVPPVADPLRTLPPPDRASLPTGSITQIGDNVTMTPGVYTSRVSFTNGQNVTMQPGIYYFEQGFIFSQPSASGTLTGTGVMLYNDSLNPSHTVEIVGQSSVVLTPPDSGVYKGILLYQNRQSTAIITLANNTTYTIAGAIYAASALVLVEVNGIMELKSHFISRMLDVAGSGELRFKDPDIDPRFRRIELVE